MKAAKELEHLSSVVTRSFFLNKSCEQNYDFSLTPEHKHFPLRMFPDFTVQPYPNSALLSPKQNRRGQAGAETRREFKMFIWLLKEGEKGKHQSVLGRNLVMVPGDNEVKDSGGKNVLHSCLHTCTKGQAGLRSCCSSYVFKSMIEMWPVKKSKIEFNYSNPGHGEDAFLLVIMKEACEP